MAGVGDYRKRSPGREGEMRGGIWRGVRFLMLFMGFRLFGLGGRIESLVG